MEDGDGISVTEGTGRIMDTDAVMDDSTKRLVSHDSVSSKSFKDLNVNAYGFNNVNGNYSDKTLTSTDLVESTEICVPKSDERQFGMGLINSKSDETGELSEISEDSLSSVCNSDSAEGGKNPCIATLNEPASSDKVLSVIEESSDESIKRENTELCGNNNSVGHEVENSLTKIEVVTALNGKPEVVDKPEPEVVSDSAISTDVPYSETNDDVLPIMSSNEGEVTVDKTDRETTVDKTEGEITVDKTERETIVDKTEEKLDILSGSPEVNVDNCSTVTTAEFSQEKDSKEPVSINVDNCSTVTTAEFSQEKDSKEPLSINVDNCSTVTTAEFLQEKDSKEPLSINTDKPEGEENQSNDLQTLSEVAQLKLASKSDKKNNTSQKGKQILQELKSTVEITDKNNGKTVEVESRMCDRTRSSRKKSEDKSSSVTSDLNITSMYSFQYTGFKSTNNKSGVIDKKTRLNTKTKRTKCNPFNPTWKRDLRNDRHYFMKRSCKDDLDCNSLQTEYAQYLGLQPLVKFRCSNCGTSTFQSMSALNTHLVDCKKNGKLVNPQNDKTSSNDSANIKLTRKVFLCSSCGTYYENCDLFLHMREYHRKYICLFCLHMTSTPDLLDEHLREKHKVVNQNYSNIEELQKFSPRSFFLLCLRCDKVFTEMDDSTNHKCVNKNLSKVENPNCSKKIKLDPTQVGSQDNFHPLSSDVLSIQKLKSPVPKIAVQPEIKDNTKADSSQNILSETCQQETAMNIESIKSSELDLISSVESVNKTIESMELQIPKGIEIKPLIPGENKPSENSEPKNDLRPGIEIFPIPIPENKTTHKTKTGLKRPMKRKKSDAIKIRKMVTKEIDEVQEEALEKEEDMSIASTLVSPNTSSQDEKHFELETKIPFVSHGIETPLDSSETSTTNDDTIQGESTDINTNSEAAGSSETVENTVPSEANLDEVKDVSDMMEVDKELESNKEVKEMNTSLIVEKNDETMSEEQNELSHEEEDSITDETQQNEVNSSHVSKEANSIESEHIQTTETTEENCMPTEIIKLKLPGQNESDNESDDSHKLSLIVDENTNNSDIEPRKTENEEKSEENEVTTEKKDENSLIRHEVNDNIPLAREDVAAMALTLDDKIENVSIQLVLKECVRTSCLSCNFCRHAVRIAVNGKQLALHLLSEHRYTPVKNETSDDVIRKLKGSLEELDKIYLNTESYDSSDPSVHVPYDKEVNLDCFHCNFSTTNHKDLYAHKRKIHVKSLLLCIMCKISFHSYSELICHLCKGCYIPGIICSADAFRCCFCRLDTIPSAFRLMVHLRKSHHTCDICLEICSDQQKLSTHMWKHKLNHLCYRCGIAYASKPDITKHLFWKHGTESVLCKKCLQKKWPHVYHFCIPPTSFNCEECNISFSKAVALKVHKRIHSNDFPYGCTLCEKKFVSKKLLSRHTERHNAVVEKKESIAKEPKDEVLNVSEVPSEEKEALQVSNTESTKEVENTETKDKCHKKHKKDKDKEKKEKKVVDVYDLPPLNLSSESDSSDDEKRAKTSSSSSKKEFDLIDSASKNDAVSSLNNESLLTKPSENDVEKAIEKSLSIIETDEKISEIPPSLPENIFQNDLKREEINETLFNENSIENSNALNSFLPLMKDETKSDINTNQNEQVEGIWENFYRTNAQNPNLPYPLCAMNSEEAYNIIMGDHDYCQTILLPSVNKVEQPTTSMLETPSLSDDKLEETPSALPENTASPPRESNDLRSSTPISTSKKKFKSPKKKSPNKTSEDNNSSSSDSSSDTDSSSCSCGTNCSCTGSSSSSNNSSSSSSDSDSSSPEDKTKQEKRKKKREKKAKNKSDSKETAQQEETDVTPVLELEDPPIRESELETDESTSDEEFYDRHPKNIADQQLAEKRQSLIIASGLPVNSNETGSNSPVPQPSPQLQEALTPPLIVETPKQKVRTKRRKKPSPKAKVERKLPSTDLYATYTNESKPSYTMFHQNPVTPKQRTQQKTPLVQNPLLASEAGGSGSETDNTRLGKRRRIKNKFYGYSSGEEDEKEKVQKWKKSDITSGNATPKYQPTSTPRIQLTVPKQVIRKPTYHKSQRQQLGQPPVTPQTPVRTKTSASSDTSDSDTDGEDRVSRPQTTAVTEETQKNEKDVYCYCRCPYDEVSEMIACDDKNCKIEWFHFECVGILVPPRGQWFCPGCRKARGLPT